MTATSSRHEALERRVGLKRIPADFDGRGYDPGDLRLMSYLLRIGAPPPLTGESVQAFKQKIVRRSRRINEFLQAAQCFAQLTLANPRHLKTDRSMTAVAITQLILMSASAALWYFLATVIAGGLSMFGIQCFAPLACVAVVIGAFLRFIPALSGRLTAATTRAIERITWIYPIVHWERITDISSVKLPVRTAHTVRALQFEYRDQITFFVDKLEVDQMEMELDPFLGCKIGEKEYFLDWWDERLFKPSYMEMK